MGAPVEAGDRKCFSIQVEITEVINSWIMGHFRFWLFGVPVGNWEDSADLKGCCNHLRDFVDSSRQRTEAGLFGLTKEDVFEMVWTRMMAIGGPFSSPPRYADAVSRFHISHLGMSSFDRVDMILVNTRDGERCIWRSAPDTAIHEALLPAGEMERVALSFLKDFDQVRPAAISFNCN